MDFETNTPSAAGLALIEQATLEFKQYLGQLQELLDKTGTGSAAASTMQALYDQVDALLCLSQASSQAPSQMASRTGSPGRKSRSFVS